MCLIFSYLSADLLVTNFIPAVDASTGFSFPMAVQMGCSCFVLKG